METNGRRMVRLCSMFGFIAEQMSSDGAADSVIGKSEWSILLTYESLTEFSQYDLPGLFKVINVDA
jgi:hypothetical protein